MKGRRRKWGALFFQLHFPLIPLFTSHVPFILILKVPWMVCLHTCWLDRTLPLLFFIFFRSKDNAHPNTQKMRKNRPKSTKTIKHHYIPLCYRIRTCSPVLLNIYKTSLVLNPYWSSVVVLKFVHKLFDIPLF